MEPDSKKNRSHNVVMRDPADLVPHSRNSKNHPKEQINQIRSSIREFGFARPVVIDDNNTILAGHGAILAAIAEDLEEIPCAELSGLSEAQKRAYIVADNKIAENAEWDWDFLGEELKELDGLIDIKVIGFTQEEIDRLCGLGDEDIEDITYGDGESSGSVSETRLKIGSRSVPITEMEMEKLNGALDWYSEERGALYGFFGWLIDRSNLNV